MRRTVLLLASIALAVVLVGGAALAATISCAGGFQRCKGTEGADVLRGDPDPEERDRLFGLGGDDELYAEAGDDFVEGGAGDDLMLGGPGSDYSYRLALDPEAMAGDDTLYGGGGTDVLRDLDGHNRIFGGGGDDELRSSRGYLAGRAGWDLVVLFAGGEALGGKGNDKLIVRNGVRNNVSCGDGTDTAYADRADALSGCEKARLRAPTDEESGAPRAPR